MTDQWVRPDAITPAAGPPADADLGTHQVTNQVPPRADGDMLGADPALVEALEREGGHLAAIEALAREIGTSGHREHAHRANAHEPVLHTHDRTGHRIDEVEFHPSWHALMRTSVEHGLAAAPWRAGPGTGAHVSRAAGFYLTSQLEQGHLCPISMTYAAVPALRHAPELAARYEPGLTSDGTYRVTGHKWFTSAPMNDLFLTLAQAPGGLTCLVLPRVLPDGTRNAIHLQRLKDKLGNRSNASSEIEYTGAVGWRVGDEGRGVATIIDMVSATRLDCVLGSAGTIRGAVVEAAHHVAHRTAFGRRLGDQPLMRAVLADVAAESEAATLLALRLAGAVDRGETALLRLALPVAKYTVCKRTAALVAEALECLGGNGYVEDGPLPRLYREAPLNSIWEGSGNVTALDALRAIGREPHTGVDSRRSRRGGEDTGVGSRRGGDDTVDALLSELDVTAGADRRLDAATDALRRELATPDERRARRLCELAAVCLQASLLVRHAPDAVAGTFLTSRLDDGPFRTAGTRPHGAEDAVLERATPR